MGAYLSRPIKEKISEDKSNKKLAYGVSSMQGWRLKQEDAHNCIIDFDENTSLFGVYDGHGGFEVARYTSEHFPDFLRNTDAYKQQSYEKALIKAFLGFDDTIPTPEVMAVLKEMVKVDKRTEVEGEESSELLVVRGTTHAGCSSQDNDDYDEDDLETPEVLRADASKPIEEVMASYRVPSINKLINSDLAKPISPYLRERREPTSKSSDGIASSSRAGCSSSDSKSTVDLAKTSAAASKSNGNIPNLSSSKDSSSCAIPKEESNQDSCTRSKCSSGESAKSNTGDGLVNGTTGQVNDDISEETESREKRLKRNPGEGSSGSSAACERPGTSPKKKKLALDDLDDSTIIKNFITNDEIAEDDEDDSEDETFQLVDETLDSDDDDDEDSNYALSKKSLAKKFLRCLNKVVRVEDNDDSDDDDDSDDEDEEEEEEEEDDDDETEDESDEEENENADTSETAQSEDVTDEGEEEDPENEDEENLDDEPTEDSGCEEDDISCEMLSGNEKPGFDSGCTAVVALLKDRDLYVANAGDSRCVICKAGQAIDMSEDHKPDDKIEHDRIVKAGGKVTMDGRVNGSLNLSRAIGDHCYKENVDLPNTEQMITALPDVRTMKLEPDVEFLVLACDGIWNSMTSQQVVDFVRPKIRENEKLSRICEELFEKCLAPDTRGDGTGCDNMTCIIVKPFNSESETSLVVSNSGAERSEKTSAIGEFGDATKLKSNGETKSATVVVNNGAAVVGDMAEATTSNGDEHSNGQIGDDTTLSSKTQKRCAGEALAADVHNKRQKTDDTNVELSSGVSEAS